MVCRLCGQSKFPVAHHIRYGGDDTGMGGRRLHVVENIILLGQGFEHLCHNRVHGNKNLWQPYLLALVDLPPNVTGLMLRRWINAGADPTEFGLELTSSRDMTSGNGR